MSATRSSLARLRTTSPASRAARAASPPWPRPSMAATRTPPGRTVTTPRSPFIASPRLRRVASPHSTVLSASRSPTRSALRAEARELVTHPPLLHRHGRSAVVVAERRLEVADASAFVASDHDEPVSIGLFDRLQEDLALADVHDDVACDLRDGRGDEGGIRAGEAESLGHGTPLGAGLHQVGIGVDGHTHLTGHPRRPSVSGGRAARAPRPDRAPRAVARGSGGTAPSRSPRPAVSRRSRSPRRAIAPS